MKAAFLCDEILWQIQQGPRRWSRGLRARSLRRLTQKVDEKFRASGYERILLTLEMYEHLRAQRELCPSELVLYIFENESTVLKDTLMSLKNQGAVILLGGQKPERLWTASCDFSFDEVLFWLEKEPKDSALSSLQKIQNLKLLVSYRIESRPLQELLRRMSAAKVKVGTSDYLELPRIQPANFWYVPQTERIFEVPGSPNITTSVVLPFQDNIEELKLTLRFLAKSLKEGPLAEVIVVDDSFTIHHKEAVKNELLSMKLPAQYVRLVRPEARQRGDRTFRAGVARNQGALYAQGQELVFLDSDILLGKDFWECLSRERALVKGPLMPKRHFLKSGIDLAAANFESLKVGESTVLSRGGHWEEFYRDPGGEDRPWKWTSTFCLALPKKVFLESGGFRRNFYCYGFEDTDLGYRLHQKGYGLRVMDVPVFHLPLAPQRSEYRGLAFQKRTLMRESFEVFQRSTLDVELRTCFQHMLDGEGS